MTRGSPMKSVKRPPLRKPPPDKPCPTCYTPMKLLGPNKWECAKHGAPKPDRPVRVQRQATVSVQSKMTDAQVDEALARVAAGETLWKVAGDMYEEVGYVSRQGCWQRIRDVIRAREAA